MSDDFATFVAETDPATITVPHDEPEAIPDVPDVPAAFAATDCTPEATPVPVDYVTPTAETGSQTPGDLFRGDGDPAADAPLLGAPPVRDFEAERALLNDIENVENVDHVNAPSVADGTAAHLAELERKLDLIVADFASIRTLILEIGPTLEALMEEAKTKGLSGLLPLLFSLRKA